MKKSQKGTPLQLSPALSKITIFQKYISGCNIAPQSALQLQTLVFRSRTQVMI